MNRKVVLRIAVSPLLIGAGLVGCTSNNIANRPMIYQAATGKAEKSALPLHERARALAEKGDYAGAIQLAEQSVELSPNDYAYRMLLGDLYLKQGRFTSAEAAFTDTLTLQPDSMRARFNLALSQIALGKNYMALVQLDRLAQTAAPADLGLAYALAGQPERAVAMLETAARDVGASGRVRQNLALAYALTGDWQRARITAAQDLSPADLSARMEQWASFATPKASTDQVASLLGVTPIQDAGQPVRLALAPARNETVALAQAEAPMEVIADPAPPPAYTQAAAYVEPAAAPAPQPAIIEAYMPPARLATAPRPSAPRAAPRSGGRYIVQLGAFNSAAAVQRGWATAQRKFGLSAYAPVSARVTLASGTFHRLSVSGFASQNDAARACQSIKGKGGACFVRTVSGDAPVRLASRS